ncbi:MAG: transglycosylase SLT domain-containing protein [Alistipes sp.]|nr:transglycosylase SLT domain-containing protein [Candidatus Alistipes equi]
MKQLRYIAIICLLVSFCTPSTSALFKKRRKTVTEVIYDTVKVTTFDTVYVNKRISYPLQDTISVQYTPRQIDSLVVLWNGIMQKQGSDFRFSDFEKALPSEKNLPVDSLYKSRLLDLISPIHLPYNYIVRNYIDYYLSSRWSPLGKILALSKYYFPTMEEELLRMNMPVELTSLAIIESNLCPTATSRAGAVGIWQLMPATARNLGLEVNSLVDERCDPIKSTKAACRFLNEMYNIFGDWTMALAAYNCGPGNVNKAITRFGSKNKITYWDIYDYLPSETRGYVPKFIAALYAYNFHRSHGIEADPMPEIVSTDTVMISRTLHLGQISSTIDVSIETLRALNPQYKIDIIPAARKEYSLTLPQSYVSDFLASQDEIYAKDSIYLKEYLNPKNLEKKRAEGVGYVYKVKKGDNLGLIAKRNHCTVKQIMKWNKLKSTKIRIGQKLRIEKPKPRR